MIAQRQFGTVKAVVLAAMAKALIDQGLEDRAFIDGSTLGFEGFARALGEFGATLMVAGNIPGLTQTMPIAIYDAVQAGNDSLANILVLIMTVTAIVVLLVVGRLSRKRGRS